MSVKVTALPELTSVDSTDVLLIVDTSTGTSKKITWANLLPDGIITPSRLATGADTDTVATSETTGSVTATDLSTPGPSVDADIGANGLALIVAQAFATPGGGSTPASQLHIVVSGATTVAAFLIGSSRSPTATQGIVVQGIYLLGGLEPGVNTFKLQYAVTGSTHSFANRRLSVIPL